VSELRIEAGGATDPGRVRPDNQDAFVVADSLFAVCDGVGGHRGGQVASRTAIDALQSAFRARSLTGLIGAVLEANNSVWQHAQSDPDLRGMASTLTAVATIDGEPADGSDEPEMHLAVANVGDSRTYLFRDGELGQISEDHSLVEELVREGRLTHAEAEVHPQRSLITRALGLERDVEVDGWEIVPFEGDRLLLCSDGLTNEVSEDRIAATLRRLADPNEAARELVRMAKDAGGHDNITVVIVDVVDDDHAAERASERTAASASERR
jgi:serine/threonine protein phosphatase PrpC